jgi:hypothetical protein
MTEGPGEGLLCDVFSRWAIETADLERTDEARVVSFVDGDEVRRRSGAGVGCDDDSLAQDGVDLRTSRSALRLRRLTKRNSRQHRQKTRV